jgi:quinol monooxygenase YgiN
MFAVMQIYTIEKKHRDEYLEAMKEVMKEAMDAGCTFFDLFEDDDRHGTFIEVMGFDSWSHYERLRKTEPSLRKQEIIRLLDTWIRGGLDAIEVRHLNALNL